MPYFARICCPQVFVAHPFNLLAATLGDDTTGPLIRFKASVLPHGKPGRDLFFLSSIDLPSPPCSSPTNIVLF